MHSFLFHFGIQLWEGVVVVEEVAFFPGSALLSWMPNLFKSGKKILLLGWPRRGTPEMLRSSRNSFFIRQLMICILPRPKAQVCAYYCSTLELGY